MSVAKPATTPISAVIITFNEENHIKACIDSLQGIADEIIVVDSFSTDATPHICRQMQVKFIQRPFEGYIEQKNFAIEQTTHPFVLSIDADEQLSEELRQSILVVKQHKQYDAYYCNRLNNYCGKWIRNGTWYPDRKLRLWDKQLGKWGGNNLHERVILQQGATTGKLKGNLLHYTVTSIARHIGQINKFTSIRAEDMFKRGIKPNAYHLYLKPPISFIKSYLLKLGFLDGYYGFIISLNSAYAVFLRYAKLRELWSKTQ